MKITIAGESKEVADNLTIQELIVEEKVESPLYVTVAVNEEFIERAAFDSHRLKDGDAVEFLYFMGGGR
jgi:sulfur carrier protein